MNLSLILARSLKKYPFKKILLGLSGGPDSMALLHLLLAVKDQLSLQIGIAHVDHGWRKESELEAVFLKNLSLTQQLPFYLHKINPITLKGNLENASRNERIAFFQKICKEESYDAVALAHHSDDLAETVLKRCLEGASVYSLHAMEEHKEWNGMHILRPLLTVSKEQLVHFLHHHKCEYFIDSTNVNVKFLRGRMRKEIFPLLNQHFGKNIRNPLCNLSYSSAEVRNYISDQVQKKGVKIVQSTFGVFADLSFLEHEVEIKHFLSSFFKEEGITLSREQLEAAVTFIMNKAANRSLNKNILFDRGYFFFLKENCNSSWKIKFEKFKRGDTELLGWKFAFSGQCRAILPYGKYVMGLPKEQLKHSLAKIWSRSKTPAFLRNHVPLLYDEKGALACEFLSGEKCLKGVLQGDMVTVSLYRE